MLCGPRKSGKSVLCTSLLKQAAALPPKMRPDLVICCCGGSQADYVPVVSKHWDSRFLFNRLPPPEFMERLFEQQRLIHDAGQQRNVLIIMDDAPVDKDVRNSITEVGYRGRHYNVSIWILAISFVMCPKGLRRSLDDEDATVRLIAARELWRMDASNADLALPTVIAALADDYVRSYALHVIARIGEPSEGLGSRADAAVPALLTALGYEDEDDRENARRALDHAEVAARRIAACRPTSRCSGPATARFNWPRLPSGGDAGRLLTVAVAVVEVAGEYLVLALVKEFDLTFTSVNQREPCGATDIVVEDNSVAVIGLDLEPGLRCRQGA